MTKINVSVLLGAACLSGLATVAAASPIVIPNSTEVEAYNGTNPTGGFFGGNFWGGNIGSPTYSTPQATISFVGDTVDIKFTTGFSGTDTTYDTPQYGNVTVHAADIFLKSGGGSAIPGPGGFDYAISLGLDTADGGMAAGLYTTASEETSQDIWGGRTQFYYGGAYATAGTCPVNVAGCANSQEAPTVLTSGTQVAGVNVTTSSTAGTFDVKLAGTGSGIGQLEGLFSDFDIFWGTGDCSNAPIWGNVAGLTNVPEPSSLALLASAVFGFAFLRRRKRKAAVVA